MFHSFTESLFLAALILLGLPALSFATPFTHSRNVLPRQSTDSSSGLNLTTPCGRILNSGYDLFLAKDAYDCLTSVPFNATVSLQFIQYYKDTLQFQSTLAYLKNPPPSYQQPPVDLLGGFDAITVNIKAGKYTNEYDFEAAVQTLLYQAHDAHVVLYAGALTAFSFGSPLRIVSVSTDGISLPKIYITDDLIESQNEDVTWQPSAVSAINGQDPIDFLKAFAAQNSLGTLEPNADFNQLMSSAAGDVQGILSAFEGSSPFYPGEDIIFNFENQTTDSLPWLATYSAAADAPVINDGADFYNYFVLGIDPDDDDDDSADSSDNTTSTNIGSAAATSASLAASSTTPVDSAPGWDYFPYPANPIVVQPNLGGDDDGYDGGVITGYLLGDGQTAVLSIPSFDVNAGAIESFSSTIGQFIQQSKAANSQRVIIDVQKNGGGGDLLATDAFKQFFPSIDPFGGSRLRAQSNADALGNTYTQAFLSASTNETFYDELIGEVWAATQYLNAETGRNFTSWGEFFGPNQYNADYFTTTQRYNLSSALFDEIASSGIVVYGFANRSVTAPQPFNAQDIIILSDGYCHSACASFVEMMKHQGGVTTVVAGGLPELGPMQTPGGARGAESYSTLDLDSDILVAESYNNSLNAILPNRDLDFYITYGGINLADAIREGSDVPLQFAYETADCRIFYTARTVYSYENLWNYVIDAIYRNPSLCIPGSTTYTSNGVLDTTGPSGTQKQQWATISPNTMAATLLGWGKLIGHKVKRNFNLVATYKRSVSGLSPNRPDLDNIIEDVTYNPNVCETCSRNQICATIPICSTSGGPVSTKNACKRKSISGLPADNGCPRGTLPFKNYCDTEAAINQAKKCNALPKSNVKQLETHPPSGLNVKNLPYGRAIGGTQAYSQYAPRAITPGHKMKRRVGKGPWR